MSGSRAKRERQSKRKISEQSIAADYTLRAAKAVLTVDLSGVPATRVSQFAVGWLRAAFEQSRIIATLEAAGLGHAAAPNRRAFWELTIRILWLGDMPRSERAGAADTMLANERTNETKTHEYMQRNGLPSDIDVAEMEEFVLNISENKVIKTGADKLAHAVEKSGMNLRMVYRLWKEDSTWAHATGFLAGQYAPTDDGETMGKGKPRHVDQELEAHGLAAMVVTAMVADILIDEGTTRDLASAPLLAYFGAN
ncbi:hypothetical protein [Arthrobacter sp. B1805]|uniref:hypothetical protein n=1 Tax=Arthrobacter sp. B1805 TaxID=2058892 RepID=UPI0011B04896|nr:hypothetical protein [Arthrobacter sp. B1805]